MNVQVEEQKWEKYRSSGSSDDANAVEVRKTKKEQKATKKVSTDAKRLKRRTYYTSTPLTSSKEREFEQTCSECDFDDYLKTLDDPRLAWMTRTLDKGVDYELKLFLRNRRYKAPGVTTVASDANKRKNRYDDIPCIDESRVILRGKPSDYIHANHVMTLSGRRFICAQGPIPCTLADFWHMILQENCRTIIMLCNAYEGNIEKVANYYPTVVGSEINICNISVILSREKVFAEFGYTDSYLDIRVGSTNFQIRHIHCTNWPDHSAPVSAQGIIEIHREILNNPPESPILVHCSAGVGRTCTFIGTEIMLERIQQCHIVSAIEVMRELRRIRVLAIQKSVQFIFMHYVLLELFCQEGVMDVNDSKMLEYRKDFEKLLKKFEKKASKNKRREMQSAQIEDSN